MTHDAKPERAAARLQAPADVRTCPRGHVKTIVKATGKYTCLECNYARNRAAREARRAQRMKERRARIAARKRPPRAERIWAAGHFEGEGTFSIQWRGAAAPVPVACLTSTDESMIEAFHAHWPGYRQSNQPNNPNARLQHTWLICRLDLLEGFILDIRPWLKSTRMREKAALLLEDVRARAAMRRTAEARAARAERHMKMRALNRRGVRREEGVQC